MIFITFVIFFKMKPKKAPFTLLWTVVHFSGMQFNIFLIVRTVKINFSSNLPLAFRHANFLVRTICNKHCFVGIALHVRNKMFKPADHWRRLDTTVRPYCIVQRVQLLLVHKIVNVTDVNSTLRSVCREKLKGFRILEQIFKIDINKYFKLKWCENDHSAITGWLGYSTVRITIQRRKRAGDNSGHAGTGFHETGFLGNKFPFFLCLQTADILSIFDLKVLRLK